MKLLLTAAPYHGHLNPLLPLAEAALAAGHEVVVATGADLAVLAAARGVQTWHVGPTRAASGTPGSLEDFARTAQERATDLLPLARRWRPDLVVAEEMEIGGAIVAAATATRLVVHGLGLAATGSPAGFADALTGLGERWAVPDLASRYLAADYVSVCPPSLQPPEGRTGQVMHLRPAVGAAGVGERLPDALETLPYADTVHLTLGTVFHDRRPEAMRTAIEGLRELPVNLVATVGPDLPVDRFGPQPSHVVLAGYLPHSLLLPRCRLVVSQGGAGILLGALAHGLPQLVLPQGADQFANGAALARSGAGLVLEGEPSAAEIADAAHLLLRAPGYARAASVLQREIAAMPTAEEVLASITA